MTQDPTAQVLTQDKTQIDSQTALQPKEGETGQAVESLQVRWPGWPTSKPGPRTTPVPAGTKAINRIRREQVTPYTYDQETGESVQPEEQKMTGEQMLGKRKQRL
jgi:hypothetical protein